MKGIGLCCCPDDQSLMIRHVRRDCGALKSGVRATSTCAKSIGKQLLMRLLRAIFLDLSIIAVAPIQNFKNGNNFVSFMILLISSLCLIVLGKKVLDCSFLSFSFHLQYTREYSKGLRHGLPFYFWNGICKSLICTCSLPKL